MAHNNDPLAVQADLWVAPEARNEDRAVAEELLPEGNGALVRYDLGDATIDGEVYGEDGRITGASVSAGDYSFHIQRTGTDADGRTTTYSTPVGEFKIDWETVELQVAGTVNAYHRQTGAENIAFGLDGLPSEWDTGEQPPEWYSDSDVAKGSDRVTAMILPAIHVTDVQPSALEADLSLSDIVQAALEDDSPFRDDVETVLPDGALPHLEDLGYRIQALKRNGVIQYHIEEHPDPIEFSEDDPVQEDPSWVWADEEPNPQSDTAEGNYNPDVDGPETVEMGAVDRRTLEVAEPRDLNPGPGNLDVDDEAVLVTDILDGERGGAPGPSPQPR